MSNKEEKYDDIEDDYKFSRHAYYKILKTGLDNLDKIAELAQDSEHPRAYEVFAKFMKDLADVNDKLIEHQRRHQIVNTARGKDIQNDQDQKQLTFTGSTDEILRMLEGNKENEEVDVEYIEVTEDEDV